MSILWPYLSYLAKFMVLSNKLSNPSVNITLQLPPATGTPIQPNNMSWSQVIARKRTSLTHTTSEYSIHICRQDKIIYSKLWKTGYLSGSVLLDMARRYESPMQLMFLIANQYSLRIAVAQPSKKAVARLLKSNSILRIPSLIASSKTALPLIMIKSSLCPAEF